MVRPNRPSSFIPSTISVGYSSLCSSCVATGRIFSSTKSRTVLRISDWMSVRPSVSHRRPMLRPFWFVASGSRGGGPAREVSPEAGLCTMSELTWCRTARGESLSGSVTNPDLTEPLLEPTGVPDVLGQEQLLHDVGELGDPAGELTVLHHLELQLVHATTEFPQQSGVGVVGSRT